MTKLQRLVASWWLLLAAAPLWAVEYDATLQWFQRVELGTLVSGVVTEVAVKPGDRVKRGQILVRLDPRGYEAQVKKASADTARLAQARDEARRELDRAQELYDRTLLSEHDLELAKIGFGEADSRYKAARADEILARLELEYSSVKAPFNAVILERHVEPGQAIVTQHQSVSLITVADADRMVAHFELSEEQLQAISPGDTAEVIIAGDEFAGTVYRIGLEPVAQGITRYAVDVLFDPTTGRVLRSGQKATVVLK